MGQPAYELWLTNDTGVRLQSLDKALWWSASRSANRLRTGHLAATSIRRTTGRG